jgi:hypothetical protein
MSTSAYQQLSEISSHLPVPPDEHMADVLNDVFSERIQQDRKFGEQNWPNGTGPTKRPLQDIERLSVVPIGRSFAYRIKSNAQVVCEAAVKSGVITFRDILLEEVFEALAEGDDLALRAELIQVAAVAVNWVQAIDRRDTSAQVSAVAEAIGVLSDHSKAVA